MLGFNHTLAGSIIGLIVPAPFVPVVAYVSHFLLDLTPHFGNDPRFKSGLPHMKRLIAVDAVICVAVFSFALWLFPNQWLMMGIGAFFSVLPDFQWIFARQLHTPQRFLDFSAKIQWGERPWGWVYEIMYSVGGCLILLNL